jgi:hypothetical protein
MVAGIYRRMGSVIGLSGVKGDLEEMSRFTFRHPEWHEVEPSVWLNWWTHRYNQWAGHYGNRDNRVYFELIAREGKLSGEDFERIGQWKEQCWPPKLGRWKTGTPAAYDVWMQAKAALPICPDKDGIAAFLKDWSERRSLASHKRRKDGQAFTQAFGISRATALLHFVSGGLYPIIDSTVQESLARLGSPVDNTTLASGKVLCEALQV